MEGRWSEAMRRRQSSSSLRGERMRTMRRGGAGRSRALAVQRRVRELQRLVPGGRDMHPDQLLMRTADYISHLRIQLQLLRALSKLYLP